MSWWARRQQRRALGDGVWRATADRLARALRSYEQMAQGVPAGEAADVLWDAFGDLTAAVADGRSACALAHGSVPSSGLDVPGGAHADLHKRLSRLGAEIAAAAEGAAMVRAGDPSALRRVTSRAAAVRAEAAELLVLARAAGAPAGR